MLSAVVLKGRTESLGSALMRAVLHSSMSDPIVASRRNTRDTVGVSRIIEIVKEQM